MEPEKALLSKKIKRVESGRGEKYLTDFHPYLANTNYLYTAKWIQYGSSC
jgi:hypothetical protein